MCNACDVCACAETRPTHAPLLSLLQLATATPQCVARKCMSACVHMPKIARALSTIRWRASDWQTRCTVAIRDGEGEYPFLMACIVAELSPSSSSLLPLQLRANTRIHHKAARPSITPDEITSLPWPKRSSSFDHLW